MKHRQDNIYIVSLKLLFFPLFWNSTSELTTNPSEKPRAKLTDAESTTPKIKRNRPIRGVEYKARGRTAQLKRDNFSCHGLATTDIENGRYPELVPVRPSL